MPRNHSSKRLDNLDHNLALGIFIGLQDLDLLERYRFRDCGGYAVTSINGTTVSLHRLVRSRMTSEYIYLDVVRHVDPNGLDCRRSAPQREENT